MGILIKILNLNGQVVSHFLFLMDKYLIEELLMGVYINFSH